MRSVVLLLGIALMAYDWSRVSWSVVHADTFASYVNQAAMEAAYPYPGANPAFRWPTWGPTNGPDGQPGVLIEDGDDPDPSRVRISKRGLTPVGRFVRLSSRISLTASVTGADELLGTFYGATSFGAPIGQTSVALSVPAAPLVEIVWLEWIGGSPSGEHASSGSWMPADGSAFDLELRIAYATITEDGPQADGAIELFVDGVLKWGVENKAIISGVTPTDSPYWEHVNWCTYGKMSDIAVSTGTVVPDCTGGTVTTPEDPPDGEDLSGLRRDFTPWLELDTEAGEEGHAQHAPLNHHPDYYTGRKSPRVESWGDVTQQLARPGEGYRSSGCTVVLGESDHFWRGRQGGGEEFFDLDGFIRLTSAEVGAAQGVPHTVMRGALVGFPPKPGLRREAHFLDALARDFREYGEEEPLLKERWKDLFPAVADAWREVRVPRRYGRYSGGLSDFPPPIPSGDPARGALFDAATNTRVFGYDNMPSGPPAPIGLTIAEEDGGTIGLAHVPHNILAFVAWCVDSEGHEGDPFPFHTYIQKTITGNGKQYRGTVTLGGGPLPHRVRVAIGPIYYRPDYAHYIEIDPSVTLEVVFTHCDAWTGAGFADGGLSAGGTRITWPSYVHEYVLLFRYVDGISAQTLSCLGPRAAPYRRPARLSGLDPGTGTPLELIALKKVGGQYRKMIVGPVTTVDEAGRPYVVDDFTGAHEVDTPEAYLRPRGALPVVDSGQEESIPGYDDGWVPFGVQGAPSHAVLKIYAGSSVIPDSAYGKTVMAPGPVGSVAQTHWDAAFPDRFRMYGGLETTTIYLRGSIVTNAREHPDTNGITVDLCGIEDLGNGRGSTIRGFGQQVLHAYNNYGLHRAKPPGAWNLIATFSDGVSKLAGFVAALEAVEVKQFGARIDGNLSLDGDVTFRGLDQLVGQHGLWRGVDEHGRLTCIRIDLMPDVSSAQHYEHERSIFGSIDIDDQPLANMVNVLPSSGEYDHVAGAYTVIDEPYEATDSIERYGVRMTKPTREFPFITSATVRRAIVANEVLLWKHPPRLVGWWTNYLGRMPHSDVGRTVLLTDVEGIGITGYVRQPIVILKRVPSLQRGLVYLWGLDIGRTLYSGARWTAPAAPDWSTATEPQRITQGFWTDPDGTIPGSGGARKEWR